MKKVLFLMSLILILGFVFSANVSCGTGSYVAEGFVWDDACHAQAYVCSNDYSLTNYSQTQNGNNVTHSYDIRSAFQLESLEECGESVRAKVTLPSKYKSCNLVGADFYFKGNDGVAFLKTKNISSVSQINSNLIKNWQDNDNGRNCYSSIIKNFGKGGELAHTQYGSMNYNCSGSFLSILSVIFVTGNTLSTCSSRVYHLLSKFE